MGDSLTVLRSMPENVRDTFGYALFLAQHDRRHRAAKLMSGTGGIIELVEHDDGNT